MIQNFSCQVGGKILQYEPQVSNFAAGDATSGPCAIIFNGRRHIDFRRNLVIS